MHVDEIREAIEKLRPGTNGKGSYICDRDLHGLDMVWLTEDANKELAKFGYRAELALGQDKRTVTATCLAL